MKENPSYRLTIEDLDPTWSEWHRGRLPDVHAVPAGGDHWWSDANGNPVEGYESGARCGGCGWRPDEPTRPKALDPDRIEFTFAMNEVTLRALTD